jgi:putative glutamine amidotransferase
MPDRPSPSAPASSVRPLIGITTDMSEVGGTGGRLRLDCSAAYADAVTAAGGTPVLLSPDPALIDHYLALCHGFLFTGGDDPRTEEYAPHHDATHPAARVMHPRRQAFETALLRRLDGDRPEVPVLGICLGMQMMALCAGGRLNQHLPDAFPTASRHRRPPEENAGRAAHAITIDAMAAASAGFPWLAAQPSADVDSHHHQAVADAGTLTTIAYSDDGLIEAVAARPSSQPARPFYLGVQWHPERTATEELGSRLFRHLIAAARGASSTRNTR